MHYSDFSPTAAHRSSLITHEQYMAACIREGSQPSHLFRSPGFSLDYLIVDVMHAGDLGTFQDSVGSLLYLEITNKQWFRNRRVGLACLNKSLDEL